MKTTNNTVTKYVYGLGLIGEECENAFKTYHFDFRGSTIAITDASGNITDTFAYDTYGKQIARTGTSNIIFSYNGKDGVVTDKNGLIYMRARYYSPELRRFANADIVAGEISNAITLNRFAYANGNPVSFVDPFGLCVRDKEVTQQQQLGASYLSQQLEDILGNLLSYTGEIEVFNVSFGNVEYYCSVASTAQSDNNINLADTLAIQKNHINILSSISFSAENVDVVVSEDGSIGFKYNCKLNDSNTFSAQVSTAFNQLSVSYSVSSNLPQERTVETTVGLNIRNATPPPRPQLQTNPVYQTNTRYQTNAGYQLNYESLETGFYVATAVLTTTMLGVAIAETVATFGAGLWNDIYMVAATIKAWGNVIQQVG